MKFLGNIEVTDEMIRRFKEKRKLAEKRRQQIMRGD